MDPSNRYPLRVQLVHESPGMLCVKPETDTQTHSGYKTTYNPHPQPPPTTLALPPHKGHGHALNHRSLRSLRPPTTPEQNARFARPRDSRVCCGSAAFGMDLVNFVKFEPSCWCVAGGEDDLLILGCVEMIMVHEDRAPVPPSVIGLSALDGLQVGTWVDVIGVFRVD